MDRTLDSIRPVNSDISSAEMSYLYGRDPSILAHGQRPIFSEDTKKNLYSVYEIEESLENETGSLTELSSQTVKVYLRLKPFAHNAKLTEQQESAYRIINSNTLVTKFPLIENPSISMIKSSTTEIESRRYTFTETFGPEATQLHFFEQAIQSQISEFIRGQNCTIMTYGTTNSGKSYTLQGTTSSPGIIPRGLEFVFANINPKPSPSYKPIRNCDVVALSSFEKAQELEVKNKFLAFGLTDKNQYIATYKQMQRLLEAETSMRVSQSLDASKYCSVWVSFAEIYNETIYDLLSNDCQKRRPSLKLATDNSGRAFIKGLKTVCVNSGSEAFQILMAGQYNLKVAATALNSRSSRSHCIFTIKLLKYNEENNPASVEVNTFSFCDLAGSERLKKTLNVGDRLKEAQNINTSLLVLGRCLKSIYDGQSLKHRNDHIGPFRESKLTRLFQRALSGKEPIALIVNVNPSPNLYIETQNVLNFAAIAKKIILQPIKQKRRKSKTRFSQIVNHNAKSITDWDDTAALDSIPEISSLELEPCPSIQPEDYEDLLEENEKLRKEISTLKESGLNREFEIRQQMADTYSDMLKKVEDHYKNQLKDAEEQQEDLMEYNVNRVEMYWKQKLSQINSRKRSRSDMSDDCDDDEIINVTELESENAVLKSKVTSLKATMKDIRRQRDALETSKNTAQYELSIVKEELKKMKDLMTSMQQDLTTKGESSECVAELQKQLKESKEKNITLMKYLKEAETDYVDVKTELEKKDRKIEERDYQIQLQTEKIRDLENDFENANTVLLERMKDIDTLEEKLERQTEQLIKAEERFEQLESVSSNIRINEIDGHTHKEEDQNEMITELRDQLKYYENENLLLSDKLSYRSNEIKLLKHDLNDAKNYITDLDKKLHEFETYRIPTVTNTQSSIEIKQEQIEYCNSECQTASTVALDQINQTSFVDNESDSLNEKLTDTEKELEKMKDNYNELQEKFNNEQINAKKLIEQLNDDKEIQDKFTVEVEECKKRVNELECTVAVLQRSESLHINMIEELKNENNENVIKCQSDHVEKIVNLKKDLLAVTQSDIMHKELIEKHLSEISELKKKLADIELLQDKASDLDNKVEKLQFEKIDLNEKLEINSKKIDEKNREIEESARKIQDKDEEIFRLQKEIKTMLQSTVDGENTMEKEFKKVLKELDDTKQLVLCKTLAIAKLQQQITDMEMLKTLVEDYNKEISIMKSEKQSLENALSLKDEDMEKFKQNRDQVIAKYEKSMENMQEELNRMKDRMREQTEYKESLRPTDTTPRTVDKNQKFLAPSDDRVYYNLRENKPRDKSEVSDDEIVTERRGRRHRKPLESPVSSNTDEIAIIELSGSESKRTTRNTVKAATTGKRVTRKKKLFTQGDDSMVDLTPSMEPPSPASARSLRSRRK